MGVAGRDDGGVLGLIIFSEDDVGGNTEEEDVDEAVDEKDPVERWRRCCAACASQASGDVSKCGRAEVERAPRAKCWCAPSMEAAVNDEGGEEVEGWRGGRAAMEDGAG